MKLFSLTLSVLFISILFTMSAQADVNILVVGSTASYSDGTADPAEDDAVKEEAFDPTAIANQLQSILNGDSAISGAKNVVFEDIYRSKYVDTAMGSTGSLWPFTYRCYSLMQYYMWPDGKTTRLANLRGASTQWDYVVIMGDPYLMANMPGVFAEGVKLVAGEVSAGTAEPILLAQWPENSSSFSVSNFNEVVYRVGDSAGIRVVPAGKAWDTYSSQDTSSSHPTPKGAYLAAASIYSEIYNKRANQTSSYNPYSAIATHANDVVQANHGVAQHSGTYTSINVWQMKYVRKRLLKYCEYGTSTEEGFNNGLVDVFTTSKIGYSRTGGSAANPVDFTYSRGTDCFEADKQYDYGTRLDNGDRTYGFPIGDHSSTGGETMRYGIDKRYYNDYWYYNGTDLGIAYSMIMTNQVALDVRGVPVRLIWAKMHDANLGFSSHRDSWHLSNELDRGVGAFMYTLLTGRCPIGAEPTPVGSTDWKYWFCRKLGYETAWQMSHLTARAPGFQVFPSASGATNLTPTTSEDLTVSFAYAPTSNVTVAVSTSDSGAGRVSPSSLTFTPQNYSNAQTVAVMGVTGTAGSHVFDITLTTSSADSIFDGLSDSWDFCNTRSAGPPPSDIIILGNGTTILAGDTTPDPADWTDFGIVTSSFSRVFAVENTSGSTSINLTGTPRVVVSGSGYFTVSSNISVSSLSPAESASFEVTFTPLSSGGHTAVVSIASTDAEVPNYAFTVGGLSPSQPSVTTVDATANGSTSAELSGQLTAGSSANAWICWGSGEVGTGSTSDWDNVVAAGAVTEVSPFSVDATFLSTNMIYWYRCYVSNAAGEAWSDTASFGGQPVGGAGGEWTPEEISLVAWYDAQDAGTIHQDDTPGYVSQWDDKSGNSNHMKQASGSAQPSYNTSDSMFGGRPSVSSPASLKYLQIDSSIAIRRMYLIVYYGTGVETSWPNHNALIGTSDGSWRLCGRSNGNNVFDGSGDVKNVDNGGTTYRNGSTTDTTRQSNGLPITGELFTITSPLDRTGLWRLLGNSASYTYWDGGLGEVIFTDGTEDLATQQKIEGYLAHKWGIQASLASGHPYESTTPGGGSGAIANAAPTTITSSSATLNASLDALGTNYYLSVYWGDSDGGSNSSAWASSVDLGQYSDVATTVSCLVSNLIRGQTYWFTFRADDYWSSPSWQFTTPAGELLTDNHLVPHTWIEGTATNAVADHESEVMDDPDGDGFTTWEEYWSGTDPNSSNSFLKIDSVSYDGSNIQIQWQHAGVVSIPPITILSTTNLQTGPWEFAGEKIPTNGANIFSDTSLPRLYYKLAQTNAP